MKTPENNVQLRITVNNNKLEVPQYLEDISDYEKKMKAWEFLNNPDRDKIIGNYMLKYKFPGPQRENVDGYTASRIINKDLGFDRTYVNEKGILIFYKTHEIEEFCKDILGKDNTPFISRDVFKDAA